MQKNEWLDLKEEILVDELITPRQFSEDDFSFRSFPIVRNKMRSAQREPTPRNSVGLGMVPSSLYLISHLIRWVRSFFVGLSCSPLWHYAAKPFLSSLLSLYMPPFTSKKGVYSHLLALRILLFLFIFTRWHSHWKYMKKHVNKT